jgi:hypothetical protein
MKTFIKGEACELPEILSGTQITINGLPYIILSNAEQVAVRLWRAQPMKFKPYDLASIKLPVSTRRRVVECVSQPTPDAKIMVRMVPGEPTTMIEVAVKDLLPYVKKRYCHIASVTMRFGTAEDMLRHDSAALYDHTINESAETHSVPFLIYTVNDSKYPVWTVERWFSFSAQLTTVAVRDLRYGE